MSTERQQGEHAHWSALARHRLGLHPTVGARRALAATLRTVADDLDRLAAAEERQLAKGAIARPRGRGGAMTQPVGFYVYVLTRPDGSPFYVGKGQRRRMYWHERKARTSCACHKCRTIRKIWREGGQVGKVIVFETLAEDAAFVKEMEVIATFGREGLVNRTDGGRGTRGVRLPVKPEWRLLRSAWAKRRWSDPEERRQQSVRVRLARQKPESRAKSSAANRARYRDPQARVAAARHMREQLRDPVIRERMLRGRRIAFADPEVRARWLAAIRATYARPEVRQRRSAQAKARYTDPDARRKMSEACKATWADPVKRAERLEKRRLAAERRKATQT